MRPGPATRAALVREFLFCFSPLGGGMTASARTALETSAAYAKASCGFVTSRSRICNRHGWPAARSAP